MREKINEATNSHAMHDEPLDACVESLEPDGNSGKMPKFARGMAEGEIRSTAGLVRFTGQCESASLPGLVPYEPRAVSSTSAAWPFTLTLRQTWEIRPSGLTR